MDWLRAIFPRQQSCGVFVAAKARSLLPAQQSSCPAEERPVEFTVDRPGLGLAHNVLGSCSSTLIH